ncbi:MAG: DUF192 domain-containing protein [Nanoarchaeota archaeon]|nr:DUF192 domain-containing protein [Nanoarchaeota archaeon]
MIFNKTKQKILAKKSQIYTDPFNKALGLMFSSQKKIKNKAIVFEFKKEQIVALHMLFVFYPIDVLFLDKNKKVVETTTLKPFCLCYVPQKKAKYVIECENGSIAKTKTKAGDIIRL